jgi:hypothetical protein
MTHPQINWIKMPFRFNVLLTVMMLLILVASCEEKFDRRQVLFTDVILPLSPTEVKIESIVVDASDDVQAFGYCWSTSPQPTIANDTVKYIGSPPTTFVGIVDALSMDVQYFVRAYVIDAHGVHYGNEISFLNNYFPLFQVTRISGFTESWFEVESSILLEEKDSISEYGHVWSNDPEPSIEDESDHRAAYNPSSPAGELTFHSQLTDLVLSTKYYVRPYYKNQWGVCYGSSLVINVPAVILPGAWTELNFPEPAEFPSFFHCGLQDENAIYLLTGNNGEYGSATTPSAPNVIPDVFSNNCYKILPGQGGVTEEIAPFPGSLRLFPRGFNINGKLYLGFGYEDVYPEFMPLKQMWEYDPATNVWRTRRTLTATGGVLFTAALNGFGYAIVKNGEKVEIWRYTPESNAWARRLSNIQPVPDITPNISNAIIAYGDHLYFDAGSSVIQYNTVANTWSVIGDFGALAFFVYKEHVYAIDGLYQVQRWEGTKPWSYRQRLPLDRRTDGGNGFVAESFVSITIADEPVIGIFVAPEYVDFIPDNSLWFKYSER